MSNMKQSHKQTLQIELMRAIRKYAISSHKSHVSSLKTALQIIGKFVKDEAIPTQLPTSPNPAPKKTLGEWLINFFCWWK